MSEPKNIIFLMTDQQRPDYVGWHPNSKVETPNLDRIAEGCAFMNCISSNPIRTPARAALPTGKYSRQVGLLEEYRDHAYGRGETN